ncbi:hypothetical protein MHH81_21125 [Psychrobacillus sp. FSL H8-0484]|uniref:hypothetical protein n=1 Tax=Psychrobacillus sp. FSL H8-0484 TaxID=2921390 RepID=UPI0030FCF60D
MKCPTCEKLKEVQFISKTFRTANDKKVTVHGIPAEVCDCDNYLSIKNMLLIEKFLKTYNEDKEIAYVYLDDL